MPTLGIQMIALSSGTLESRYHVVLYELVLDSLECNENRASSASAAIRKYRIRSDKLAEN